MKGHRYFCMVLGRVKIENWHLYLWRRHQAIRDQKLRWYMWDLIV